MSSATKIERVQSRNMRNELEELEELDNYLAHRQSKLIKILIDRWLAPNLSPVCVRLNWIMSDDYSAYAELMRNRGDC